GEGEGQTTIQGQGSPAMAVSSGSTVANLTINLNNQQAGTGLGLGGSATDVAVTATGLTWDNPIGVDLAGGTFSHGTIALPLTEPEAEHFAGVIGSGTISDSTITAAVGAGTDGSGASPTVTRDRITANQGVLAGLSAVIDDSLISTAPGAAP